MKYYIKACIMLIFLNLAVITLPMQDASTDQNEENISLNESQTQLPTQAWPNILMHLYIQPEVLVTLDDIHQAVKVIKKNIAQNYLNLSLSCKFFKGINIPKLELKNKIYNYLNLLFLENRAGAQGFYPKQGEWMQDELTNNNIAKFFAGAIPSSLFPLANIINKNQELQCDVNSYPLIKLALFYGADSNVAEKGNTPLKSVIIHSNKLNYLSLIRLLLRKNAEVNSDISPLITAIQLHRQIPNKNIIILLLIAGTDYNFIVDKKTVAEYASEKGIKNFDRLATMYSSKISLRGKCMKFILMHLPQFKNELHRLPLDIRNLFIHKR